MIIYRSKLIRKANRPFGIMKTSDKAGLLFKYSYYFQFILTFFLR